MPSSKNKVKRETRLAKISQRRNPKAGRLKAIEPTARGGARHITDASQVGFPCVGQCRSDINTLLSDFKLFDNGLQRISGSLKATGGLKFLSGINSRVSFFIFL